MVDVKDERFMDVEFERMDERFADARNRRLVGVEVEGIVERPAEIEKMLVNGGDVGVEGTIGFGNNVAVDGDTNGPTRVCCIKIVVKYVDKIISVTHFDDPEADEGHGPEVEALEALVAVDKVVNVAAGTVQLKLPYCSNTIVSESSRPCVIHTRLHEGEFCPAHSLYTPQKSLM
jgi:hypothetical protein